MKSSLLAVLPAALLVACVDQPAPTGALQFESRFCGRDVCDLTAPLATDSRMQLDVHEAVYEQLLGATIESTDPTIARIGAVLPGLILKAEIIGVADGDVELMVLDKAGEVIDTLPLRVRTADKLDLGFALATAGTIQELDASSMPGIDRALEVSKNTGVEISAIAVANGEPLIGAFSDYAVEVLSTGPADEQPQPTADANFGRFVVFVSAFEHDVTVYRAGVSATVRLRGY